MADPTLYTSGTSTQNYQQVAPHDPTAHAKYQFYVLVTAEGGATRWSSQYTLIVGCTDDAYQTNSGSLGTTTTVYVPDSGSQIYRFYPPTPFPSYCSIIQYEIVELTKVTGYANASLVFDSSGTTTCTGSIADCQYLTLPVTDHIQQFTFKIRTTLTNNADPHDSPLITINVACRKTSTAVYS